MLLIPLTHCCACWQGQQLPLTRGGLPWRSCSERACVRAVLLQAQRGRPEDVFVPLLWVLRDALELVPHGWLHQCVAPRRQQRVEGAQEEEEWEGRGIKRAAAGEAEGEEDGAVKRQRRSS